MTELILALDLGTTSIKSVVVDRNGSVVDIDRNAHNTTRPINGVGEQDPGEWWSATRAIVSSVTARMEGQETIAAVAITGQMHGLVLRDNDDALLGNAITWQDQRSAGTLPNLLGRLPADHPARHGTTIAPGYLVASWHWLTQYDPDRAHRSERVSLPKDEIVYRLTGQHATDPSDAVGTGLFDVTTRDWDRVIADAAKLPLDFLPKIVPSGAVAGTIQPRAAAELGLKSGIPVIVAGGDAAAGAFGAGLTEPDQTLLMLSSGCQLLRPHTNRPAIQADGAFVWPSACPVGLPEWLEVGTTLNGGNAIDWASRTMYPDHLEEELDGKLDRDDELSPPPLFIPYLGGERAPISAEEASGAFLNLGPHHRSAGLIQAVAEGVTLAAADVYTRMGGQLGADQPLRVGGGGAQNRRWLNAISRIFAMPLDVMAVPDLSARGAARIAATTLGWFDPVADPGCWLPEIETIPAPPVNPEAAHSRLESFRTIASGVTALTQGMPR